MRNTLRALTRWVAMAAVAAMIVLSAACSAAGGGSQDAASGTTSTTADAADAMLAYSRCMKANGVDIPVGAGVRGRGDSAADDPTKDPDFRRADEACKEHRRGVAVEDPSTHSIPPDQQDAMVAYARCMRDNGLNMPDPSSGGLVGRVGEDGLDPKSPSYRAAHEKCRSHLADLPVEEGNQGP